MELAFNSTEASKETVGRDVIGSTEIALMLFKRIADFGRISDITKFRNEGGKIFSFKPQPDRFLSFFYVGKKIVVTNGFRKKAQKLPKKEKEEEL
jgi:hypothetical protein